MGPYRRIDTAETLKFPNDEQVLSPQMLIAWHALQLTGRDVTRWASIVPVVAFINHGRWVANCLNCKFSMLVRPSWPLACCAECGGMYQQVVFPPNITQIELTLLERPQRETHNWLATETIDDLKRENELHRVELDHFSLLKGQ